VATRQTTEAERILADRERFVARGVATTGLVVACAEGATVVDGRSYVDFAGGLG
jgi:4-aminobutyrate aminotransferase-like enzyme